MRVISGTARGRRLIAPEGAVTRPTPDRVREATFNALGSLGAVAGASVLDLFAGSGAMGIEALSRGAADATFVDQDRSARAALEANLAATRLAAHATVVTAPVERFLLGVGARHWDLALIDPPYAYDHEAWLVLLDQVPADLAVLESGRPVDPPFGWEVLRSKRYGHTHVTIAERRPV